jgi:16S rRNA A1518/A1519 N6-dimethyltransferase RsmA/KsgA/DIM1 with predicted DNA glycosylase/AP lyase activity
LVEPDHRRAYVQVVKRSFSQRRKRMAKLLRTDWPAERLSAALAHAGVGEDTRAEAVSVAQFATLAAALAEAAPA